MEYSLPKTAHVAGREYSVRSDYRAILDICVALVDPELTGEERAEVMLRIFYPDFEEMPTDAYQEAIEKCIWFINCGSDERNQRPAPKLMDWEQDFNISWPQ